MLGSCKVSVLAAENWNTDDSEFAFMQWLEDMGPKVIL